MREDSLSVLLTRCAIDSKFVQLEMVQHIRFNALQRLIARNYAN